MRASILTRSRRLMSLVSAIASAGAIAACSNSTSPSTPTHHGTTGPAPQNLPLLGSLKPAANDKSVSSPFDATPDLDGSHIYFTAIGAQGAGVFKVAASGGPITTLFEGAPLVSPFSIAMSSDGKQLLVADLGAASANADAGVIFSLPIGGGTPEALTDADGMIPRGLEVADDTLYFTGTAKGGAAGVFSMPVGGGAVTTLASGGLFNQPSGVAIARSGDLYVVDTGSAHSADARILKVPASGAPSVFIDGLAVGFPAGIVFDMAQTTLLVSARDTEKGTDAVLVIDVGAASATEFTTGIDKFVEPAGLHRAHGADVFAWADSRANQTGTVYVITR
jgi:DNA-binding beta-propeller fold protein YncE